MTTICLKRNISKTERNLFLLLLLSAQIWPALSVSYKDRDSRDLDTARTVPSYSVLRSIQCEMHAVCIVIECISIIPVHQTIITLVVFTAWSRVRAYLLAVSHHRMHLVCVRRRLDLKHSGRCLRIKLVTIFDRRHTASGCL